MPSTRHRNRKKTRNMMKNKLWLALIWFTLVMVMTLLLLYIFVSFDPWGMFATTTMTPSVGLSNLSVPIPTLTPTSLPTTKSPQWWEVYFTDPLTVNDSLHYQGSIEEVLITYIHDAKISIHIASFEFDLTPVAEALIAAHQRGVDVRWVTDDESGLEADSEPGHGQFAMLRKAGIEIRSDHRGALMHNKFWIFDGTITWTGSTNITESGIFKQNNNVIVIRSPEVAAMYEREFEEMWEGKFGSRSPSTVDQQRIHLAGSQIQVLFSPEDQVMPVLIGLMENAQKRIHFMAFSFTENALGEAMLQRVGSGVEVKGIFERTGSETEFSELPKFFCRGVEVRQDGNPYFMHHKVIIVDDTVITGSLNFSSNAAQSNDENVIVITHADIAARYEEEFQRLWAQGSEPSFTCP